ncbi:extracellular solute-binding protein [bacterium AH-315-E10]|nr:extracellular solute-binding protein [bacterium AH-315-E10]
MKTRILIITFLYSLLASADPITIWISSYQDKKYYEDLIQTYKMVDKSFTATLSAFGFTELPEKFSATIKIGKGAPDIVQLDEVLFSTFLRGQPPFVDLTSRIKEAKLGNAFHPQRMDLFSVNNKQYGLPQSLSTYILFYRKDMFNELDVKHSDLSTWDKLLKTGKTLAKNDQALMPMDPSYFGVLLRQRGGTMFDKKGLAFPDFKLAVDTLEFLATLCQEGIAVMPDRGSIYDPVFFQGDVSRNEIACILGADWYGLDMIQNFCPNLKGKWGMLPMPKWTDKLTRKSYASATFAGQGLFIYNKSRNIEKAWQFLKWAMTDKGANRKRFVGGNSFPAYKAAWTDNALLAPSEYFGNESMGKLILSVSKELPPITMNAKRAAAVFLLSDRYFASVMSGHTSAEDALRELKIILDKQ